jgi:PAS domain S-box-containing protein
LRSTHLAEKKRIAWLILVMMAAVSISTAVAVAVTYSTAFEKERLHLIQSVDDQTHLMEAVARFDQKTHGGRSQASEAATLSQVQNAFDHFPSFGDFAEITIARREGDSIVFLVTHGRMIEQQVEPIPFASGLAEPMRRALSGQSGSMIGLDYRGVRVLAAYKPVPIINIGVVAKMDLADVRAPFIRGAVIVIGLAFVLISAGAVLFLRLTNPIVKNLTESEQRHQLLFSGAPVPIWEQDFSEVSKILINFRRSGVTELKPYLADNPEALRHLIGKIRINEVNQAALQLFATRSRRQFVDWFERNVVPNTGDIFADVLQALWEGDEALVNRSVSVKTQGGSYLTVLLSMVIPRASDGYNCIPVSALDVTAGLNLRQREEELDLILESTGEGIFGVDSKGQCTFVNRAALSMLGYEDEKMLLGREMHSLIHHTCRNGEPLPPENCPIYRTCCQNIVVHLEDEELWRADHTSFPVDFQSYPMLRDGAVVGTVVTFIDITERKERETQHLHAQKMEVMGQLTGGIAHDFNNLLAIILVNLRMLAEQFAGKLDEETLQIIDDTLSAAEDGAEFTDRLLVFSRRQAKEPRLSDINILLGDYHNFLDRIAGDNVDLIIGRAEGPLLILIDSQQFENAILNLVINARDAMPEGGTLTIEARRRYLTMEEPIAQGRLEPGGYVVVSVADTGTGMSREAIQHAVEPFYTTKPPGKGSGLGLSMAFSFAHQAGGGLMIESALGRGTTVSLYLPEAVTVQGEPVKAQPRQTRSDGTYELATILLVDDEQRTRRFARRLLSELGYQVLEAENAAAATSILEQDVRVDLLFTDVVMPGELNGRDLGYWAREHRPGLKVLLTSVLPQQAPSKKAPDGEILPFLKKPYSKEQLQEAIQTLLFVQAS